MDVTFGPWAKRTRRGRYEQADGLKRELKGTFYMSRTFDFARELQIKGETFNDKKRGCKTYGREWDIRQSIVAPNIHAETSYLM